MFTKMNFIVYFYLYTKKMSIDCIIMFFLYSLHFDLLIIIHIDHNDYFRSLFLYLLSALLPSLMTNRVDYYGRIILLITLEKYDITFICIANVHSIVIYVSDSSFFSY